MNASRLLEVLKFLIDTDQNIKYQSKLENITSHIQQLVGNPSNTDAQTNFRNSLEDLRESQRALDGTLDNSKRSLISEIGGSRFFLEDVPSNISRIAAENPITPIVIKQYIEKITSERREFISLIMELRDRLEKIGVAEEALPRGLAEVGFSIPREVFDNKFDSLISEMGQLKFLVRAMSIAATGSAEEVTFISSTSSDPMFYIALTYAVARTIAATTHWALDTLKKVEEIRLLRRQISTYNFDMKDIEEALEGKIQKFIDSNIEEKITELTSKKPKKSTFSGEFPNELRYALKFLLAHLEQGMVIEFRSLPPVEDKGDDGKADGAYVTQIQDHESLTTISRSLVFPKPSDKPVLQIVEPPHVDDTPPKAPPPPEVA